MELNNCIFQTLSEVAGSGDPTLTAEHVRAMGLDPQGDRAFLVDLLEVYGIDVTLVIDNLCCPWGPLSLENQSTTGYSCLQGPHTPRHWRHCLHPGTSSVACSPLVGVCFPTVCVSSDLWRLFLASVDDEDTLCTGPWWLINTCLADSDAGQQWALIAIHTNICLCVLVLIPAYVAMTEALDKNWKSWSGVVITAGWLVVPLHTHYSEEVPETFTLLQLWCPLCLKKKIHIMWVRFFFTAGDESVCFKYIF